MNVLKRKRQLENEAAAAAVATVAEGIASARRNVEPLLLIRGAREVGLPKAPTRRDLGESTAPRDTGIEAKNEAPKSAAARPTNAKNLPHIHTILIRGNLLNDPKNIDITHGQSDLDQGRRPRPTPSRSAAETILATNATTAIATDLPPAHQEGRLLQDTTLVLQRTFPERKGQHPLLLTPVVGKLIVTSPNLGICRPHSLAGSIDTHPKAASQVPLRLGRIGDVETKTQNRITLHGPTPRTIWPPEGAIEEDIILVTDRSRHIMATAEATPHRRSMEDHITTRRHTLLMEIVAAGTGHNIRLHSTYPTQFFF